MSILDRVEIHHSLVYDFLASMYRLNNNEKFVNEIEELRLKDKIKLNDEILNWVKKNKEIIPKNIQEKFDIYFNRETFYGLCLTGLVACSHIDTIDDFIDYIGKLSHEDILTEFLDTGFGTGEEVSKCLVQELLNSEKEAILYINKNISIPSKQKWELLQFFLNPEKMKEDLITLFKWHYDNVYKYDFPAIEELIKKYEEGLKEKLEKYGDDYLKLLTKIDYKNYKPGDRIFISVSYFYETSRLYGYRDEPGMDIYMIGYRYAEVFVEGKHALLSNVQMFKALADETRLNMVKLLCERPWYGHELAMKLNLSNSTISYHLSMLGMNDLVKVDRVDNRTYFKSDIESIKKVVCESLDKMIE